MKRVLEAVLAGLMIVTAFTACSGIKKLTPADPEATRKFVEYSLKNGEFIPPAQVAYGTASYLEEKDKELKIDQSFRRIVDGVVDGIKSVK